MIEARDLRRVFGGINALDGVTLSVAEGERRAVIGPNGAGKTTLFNVLTGETKPTSGRVRLAGVDVTARPPHELARRGLARMYQRNELFEPFSARENVALALAAARGPFRPFTGPPASERTASTALLERVGLASRGDVTARALSHGERRQLELALALAQRPRVLLLDEPTAGMSSAETASISGLLASLDRSITLVI
ncbi:MAG TPA: ATP-binding cassette domain-containing protein, partial [Candidatus Limnocylindrales bacterium]|nr:ATP-binding cassette domain-containing protein [Candidatus Limnocylindrales bacterium]